MFGAVRTILTGGHKPFPTLTQSALSIWEYSLGPRMEKLLKYHALAFNFTLLRDHKS